MKDKTVAALLAFFLGALGVHKFYMGKIGSGFLYLIFWWTGIPGIIAFIDFIVYLTCTDKEFNERYCGIKVSDSNAGAQSVNTNSNDNSNVL